MQVSGEPSHSRDPDGAVSKRGAGWIWWAIAGLIGFWLVVWLLAEFTDVVSDALIEALLVAVVAAAGAAAAGVSFVAFSRQGRRRPDVAKSDEEADEA